MTRKCHNLTQLCHNLTSRLTTMTKQSEYISLEEAAKLIGKSERTIRRYLDNYDKSMSKKEKNKLLIKRKFVTLVTNGLTKDVKSDKDVKEVDQALERLKEELDDKKESIKRLEQKNDKLLDDLRTKDSQLMKKDESLLKLVEDFKILTSKVVALQDKQIQLEEAKTEEIKQIEEAKLEEVKELTEEKNGLEQRIKELETTPPTKEKPDKDVKLFIIIFLVAALMILGAMLLGQNVF